MNDTDVIRQQAAPHPAGSATEPGGGTIGNPVRVVTAEELSNRFPQTHSRCGWCSTSRHSQCPGTLQSLPGWRCGCGCRREERQ